MMNLVQFSDSQFEEESLSKLKNHCVKAATPHLAQLLVHSPSAAHIQQLTRKPVSLFGRQKHDDVGNVVWPANAAQRRTGGNAGFFIRGEITGLDWTWSNDVNRDAVLPHLRCRRATVGLNGMFAGGIADVGDMGMRRIGADVDDTAGLALPRQKALEIFRHHQGNGATVDGEVRIDALDVGRCDLNPSSVTSAGSKVSRTQ